MKKNKFALQIISFGIIVLTLIACDTDFATLESDVINNDVATNFDIISEKYDIITNSKNIGPVQSNRLGLNTLGVYEDIYGRTKSGFVSQVSATSYNPTFGEDVEIDSVVVTIPYFSEAIDFDDEGNTIYELDSVISAGGNYNNIKLRIFENNFFLRDFDPTAGFDESQAYYTNRTASASEQMQASLEGEELTMIRGFQSSYLPDDNGVDNVITFSEDAFVLEGPDTDEDEDLDPQILERQAPALRVKLDPVFWKNKIMDKEGDAVLSNQNNLADYFRGLYFKAESYGNFGSFLILDTGSTSSTSNITIYYTSLKDGATDRTASTYVLRFGTNKVNFIDNTSFTQTIENRITETGDTRIFLKGGEGAIGGVKLFNGDDLDNVPEMNAFETFKNAFVETDDDGNFKKAKRLVNEANLVFYVDRDQLDLVGEDPDNEPNRLYLYDIDNKTPLIDYYLDATNSSLPSFSKFNHLGILERDESDNDRGIKYKLKITEHINNLLLRDSTNVELGLAVSLNVNLENSTLGLTQSKVQNSDDFSVPVSSILSPRGTILHGSGSEDESKQVYLEIYYTEPN